MSDVNLIRPVWSFDFTVFAGLLDLCCGEL